jgi:hypothetical protein
VIVDVLAAKVSLGVCLDDDDVVTDLVVSLTLLGSTPDTLDSGSSLDDAELLGGLAGKVSTGEGLRLENSLASLEVLLPVEFGTEVLLDEDGARVETSSTEVLQESQLPDVSG